MAKGETLFEYVMYGPVLVPIAALGIIGNILSIIVYTRPSMRKSAINIILIGMYYLHLIEYILWNCKYLSLSPHMNNQYESPIFATSFCLLTLLVYSGKIKVLY